MRHRLALGIYCLLSLLLALPSSAAPSQIIVVFPFAVSGAAIPAIGNELTDQIAAEAAAPGDLTVIRGDAQPSEYRNTARANGADAYLTGTIMRVGTTYSAIVQLVSSRTSVLMWSQSIHFRTLAEAAGVGRRFHDVLVHPAVSLSAGAVAAAARPAPSATPAALRETPAVAPSAKPAAVETPSTTARGAFAVMPMGGSADAEERTYATAVVVASLRLLGLKAVAVVQSVNPESGGSALCATTGATALLAGTLTTKLEQNSTPPQISASVALRGYRCAAQAIDPDLGPSTFMARNDADAIRQAINNAVLLLPSVHLTKRAS
jgi:TolB-like protein